MFQYMAVIHVAANLLFGVEPGSNKYAAWLVDRSVIFEGCGWYGEGIMKHIEAALHAFYRTEMGTRSITNRIAGRAGFLCYYVDLR
jgi:hypothetical protein